MAFVLVNFSWAFRADRKIPNEAELQTRYMHGYQATSSWSSGPASLVVLFIFLIAVLHGDALEPSAFADRCRGLLYSQPVPDGLVGFAVQGGVQHALQSEIPVRLLQWEEAQRKEEIAQRSGRTPATPLRHRVGATNGKGWDARQTPALEAFCIAPGSAEAEGGISAGYCFTMVKVHWATDDGFATLWDSSRDVLGCFPMVDWGLKSHQQIRALL